MKTGLLIIPIFFLLFSCASAPETGTGAVSDASAERAKALEAMELAKSVKADVAMKADYDKALSAFNDAEAQLSSGADTAAAKFAESAGLFQGVYGKAKAARDEAMRQLTIAKDSIKAVEEEAQVLAQEQAAGGSQ